MKLAIAITTATTLFSNSALAQNANVSFDTGADEECCIDTVRAATEAAGHSLSTWFGDDEAAQSQAIEALCDSARSKNSNPNRGACKSSSSYYDHLGINDDVADKLSHIFIPSSILFLPRQLQKNYWSRLAIR